MPRNRTTLSIVFPEKSRRDYEKVVALAKQHKQTMSTTGRNLVYRGLERLNVVCYACGRPIEVDKEKR